MITAEAVIAAVQVARKLVDAWRGRAKFVDGTTLEQSHVDAAWAKADAPFERIEDRAKAELERTEGE